MRRTVKRLLDGNHIWVSGGLSNKLHHHVERFIWVVHHKIFLSDGGKNIAAMVTYALRIARHIRREFKIRSLVQNQLLRISKAYEAFRNNGHILRSVKLLSDEIAQIHRALRIHFHANNLSTPPKFECGFKQPHEILSFFFNFKIAVTDHAEQAAGQHVIAGKKPWQKKPQHIFQHDETCCFTRQANEPFKQGRNGQQCAHFIAVNAAFHFHRHNKPTVQDERKWMGWINRDGRNHRQNLFKKPKIKPSVFGLSQTLNAYDGNTIVTHFSFELNPAPILFRHQLQCTSSDKL